MKLWLYFPFFAVSHQPYKLNKMEQKQTKLTTKYKKNITNITRKQNKTKPYQQAQNPVLFYLMLFYYLLYYINKIMSVITKTFKYTVKPKKCIYNNSNDSHSHANSHPG